MAMLPFGTGRAGTTLSASGGSQRIQWLDGDFNPLAEANVQRPMGWAMTVTQLMCRLVFNDTTGAGTFKSRKAAADGGQSISIPLGDGAKEYQDTSGSDAWVAGDLVNMISNVGTGGTGYKYSYAAMVANPIASVLFGGANLGATVLSYCLTNNGTNTTASESRYFAPGSTNGVNATETAKQKLQSRCAGALVNLTYSITTSTRTTTTTFGTNVNGTPGTILISIPGSSPAGQYAESSPHSDAVAVGGLWDTMSVTSTGVGIEAATVGGIDFVTLDAKATYVATTSNPGAANGQYNPGATTYFHPQAKIAGSTTQQDQQMNAAVTGIASLYEIYVSTNGAGATSTLTFEVGGVSGNGAISILSSDNNKWLEDTTHSDALVNGSEIGWKLVVGAGGTLMELAFLALLMDASAQTRRRLMPLGIGHRHDGELPLAA